MKYTYKALTDTGTIVSGEIEASTREEASEKLAQNGYIPQKVRRGEELKALNILDNLKDRLTKVKAQELILFSKQFRTMFRAGVSIIDTFKTLQSQTSNKKLQKIILQMQEDIKEGSSLYRAFSKHPNVFSSLYCNMIYAGEVSGSLPEVMDRLIYLLEHEYKVKSDIRAALQYPIIVVIALSVAFFILLTFVIPKFVQIFKASGIDLPLPTVIALNLYKFLADYWFLCLGIVIGTVIGSIWYFRTEQGRFLLHSFLLKVPIIGPVMQKAAMSRFASIFAILQTSGITVLNSLDILSKTIGNAAISREFARIQNKLKEGRGISDPLQKAIYFPPMVVNMVAIGEESGNLDEMLQEVTSHYDDEVSYSVSQMSANLGPILIVGLAAVVGFFALAIFLPMWDLTKMVR